MKKQLLSLMIGLEALVIGAMASGCADKPKPDPSRPVQTLSSKSFAADWKADLQIGDNRVTALHLRDKAVFVYTAKNQVYVLDRKGGQIKHIDVVSTPGRQVFPPVQAGERIVFPTAASIEVYTMTGQLERSISFDFAVRSPAVAEGDRVYLCADYPNGGTRLVAIDLSKTYQPVLWGVLLQNGTATAAPAYFNEVIYAGNHAGRIYAVTEDRNPIWPLEQGVFLTQGRIWADVHADSSGVYFASTDSKLYCVDRTTGKVNWQYFSGEPLKDSPSVTSRMIYLPVPGTGLVAIDKTAGKYNREAKWTVPGATLLLAEDEKYAYVRGEGNRILAVELATGKQVFASERDDFAVFASNFTNGVIYAATVDGHVYAIRPILTGGEAGEMVLDIRPVEVAMAQ